MSSESFGDAEAVAAFWAMYMTREMDAVVKFNVSYTLTAQVTFIFTRLPSGWCVPCFNYREGVIRGGLRILCLFVVAFRLV